MFNQSTRVPLPHPPAPANIEMMPSPRDQWLRVVALEGKRPKKNFNSSSPSKCPGVSLVWRTLHDIDGASENPILHSNVMPVRDFAANIPEGGIDAALWAFSPKVSVRKGRKTGLLAPLLTPPPPPHPPVRRQRPAHCARAFRLRAREDGARRCAKRSRCCQR